MVGCGLGQPDPAATAQPEPRPTDQPEAPREPRADVTSMVLLVSLLDPQQTWLDDALLRPVAEAEGYEVRTVFFDDPPDLESMLKLDRDADLRRVGLALVDQVEMRRLVEKARLRSVTEVEGNDQLVEAELRDHLALARDATRVVDKGDDVYGVPNSVDVPVMVYRRSRVDEALRGWESMRGELEALFKTANGRGLPAGYTLESDPSRWDSYDLAVVAYFWANTPYGGVQAPRVAHRGYGGPDTALDLYQQIYSHGGGAADVLAVDTDPVLDALAWEAFMARSGLYPAAMWQEAWGMGGVWAAMGEDRVFLSFMCPTEAAILRGLPLQDLPPQLGTPDDLAVARIPRGVSLDLGTDGQPLRVGDGAAPANVSLWVIPRTSPDTVLSHRLATAFTTAESQAKQAAAFAAIPTRQDALAALSALAVEPWLLELVTVGSQQAQLSRPLPTVVNADAIGTQYAIAWRELMQAPAAAPLDRAALRAFLAPHARLIHALVE